MAVDHYWVVLLLWPSCSTLLQDGAYRCNDDGTCPRGAVCLDGRCWRDPPPCEEVQRCGPKCEACAGETPWCGGADIGCACNPDPAPRGSCASGKACLDNACVACEQQTACGPECLPCQGDLLLCGGAQAGCVASDCLGRPDFTPCQLVTSPDRWYDICVNGACVSPGCGDTTCNPPGPSFARADAIDGWEYPDTNQRECYGVSPCPGLPCVAPDSFCGQDAQYGWDTSHAASERWVRTNSDQPIVADKLTGMVWQGCPAGRAASDCSAGTILGMSWSEALQYCNDLSWAGQGDWRLPDWHELEAMGDIGATGPAVNQEAFAGGPADGLMWTSSTYAVAHQQAWFFGMYDGTRYFVDKANPYFVMCVRSRPLVGSTLRFAREDVGGQFVVTDAKTGLLWQGCVAGRSGGNCTGTDGRMTWQEALTYCEGLSWGASDAWRLPSRAELTSILSTQRSGPSVDTVAFPSTPSGHTWTSSTVVAVTTSAWYCSFNQGYVSDAGKGNDYCVRCVRSPP